MIYQSNKKLLMKAIKKILHKKINKNILKAQSKSRIHLVNKMQFETKDNYITTDYYLRETGYNKI